MGFADQESSFGYDMGTGMLGGSGMMGGFTNGGSMMGGFSSGGEYDPLSVDEARDAVESYLDGFNDQDLMIEEIMIFDNNAYAIVIEKSTGIGAFELLIDPATNKVFPEFGPNMIWNLKYGMMGSGMMGSGVISGGNGSGMMDNFFHEGSLGRDLEAEMSVSEDQAFEFAQDFLNEVYLGIEVSDEITQFYGYYTIDTERDGKVVGMLSVNEYSGYVFPHIWHGEFIEMVEE